MAKPVNLPFFKTFQEFKNIKQFNRLSMAERAIVFYAEDKNSWVHFEPIIHELTQNHGQSICYVTSCANDPMLNHNHPRIRVFYIGGGTARTWFFETLRVRFMIMTMPDLETFHIKRSQAHPVHYIYIHHSMVSTHAIYRKGAFDHFDTIFCVGEHQIEETRQTEKRYHLKEKNLVRHGYGRLDSIMLRAKETPSLFSPDSYCVLIAPTWGKDTLLGYCGVELIQNLLEGGYRVIVRPHPVTLKESKSLMAELRKRFLSHSHFTWDEDIVSQESFHRSHLMISDWSGVALEFAFGLERPVLFMDIPRKTNNPHSQDIPCIPLEDKIRSQIGEILNPEKCSEVSKIIEKIKNSSDAYREKIQRARSQYVFNVGKSGAIGAQAILDCLTRDKIGTGNE